MYDNTGNKIKGYAKTMAIIDIVFCIIVAVVFLFVSFRAKTGLGFFGFLAASLIVGIGGSIFAWFKFLFLAGYGELIEETTKSTACLEDIKDILIEMHSQEEDDEICLSSKSLSKNENKLCSYCGSVSDVLISRLCSDCNNLLSNGTIMECSNCGRYNYKGTKCKCQFW